MPWRYGIVKFRNKHNPDHRFYGIGELFMMKIHFSLILAQKIL